MIESGCIMRHYDCPVEITGRVEPYGCDDVDDRQHPGLADDRDDFPSQGRDDPASMGQPKYDGHVWCGYGTDDFPSQGRDDRASQVPMVRPKYDDRVYLSHTDRRDDFPSQGRIIQPVRLAWVTRTIWAMIVSMLVIMIAEIIFPPVVEMI